MHVLKKIAEAVYRVSEATVDFDNAIAEFFFGTLLGQERKEDATVDFKRLLDIREEKSGFEAKPGDLVDESVEVVIIFMDNHVIVGIIGFGDSPLKLLKGPFGVLLSHFRMKSSDPLPYNPRAVNAVKFSEIQGHRISPRHIPQMKERPDTR